MKFNKEAMEIGTEGTIKTLYNKYKNQFKKNKTHFLTPIALLIALSSSVQAEDINGEIINKTNFNLHSKNLSLDISTTNQMSVKIEQNQNNTQISININDIEKYKEKPEISQTQKNINFLGALGMNDYILEVFITDLTESFKKKGVNIENISKKEFEKNLKEEIKTFKSMDDIEKKMEGLRKIILEKTDNDIEKTDELIDQIESSMKSLAMKLYNDNEELLKKIGLEEEKELIKKDGDYSIFFGDGILELAKDSGTLFNLMVFDIIKDIKQEKLQYQTNIKEVNNGNMTQLSKTKKQSKQEIKKIN